MSGIAAFSTFTLACSAVVVRAATRLLEGSRSSYRGGVGSALALALAMVVSGGAPGVAVAHATEQEPELMATPVLLAEHDSFLLGGTTTVGIRFTIEPEWHIYWAGLNDTGFPVEAVWETPAGVEVGPLQWPVPKRYVSPGEILDYVYENEVTLLADVTVAADVRGPLEIRAALSWLACREACIPEDAAVAIALPVVRERSGDSAAGVSGAGRSSADGSAVIRRAREAMPIPLPSAQQDLVIGWASSAVLEIAAAGPATSIAFFPHETSLAFERPIETGATKGDRLRLHIDAGAPGDAEVMRGIVEIRRAPDATPVSYWIEADPRHASAADRTAGIRTWD